jgi:hypothetical protein
VIFFGVPPSERLFIADDFRLAAVGMPRQKAVRKTDSGIWKQVIQFEQELSPAAARALLKVRFPQGDKERMSELSGKARGGSLTSQEKAQIETYEQLGCLLDILHSKARQALNKRRTAS